MSNIVRVLIAKPGLDGHDRGAKVVARGLRDAGFEVIYTGLHQSPEMVVNAAIQEDVDIVGLSILSGAHIPLVEAIIKLFKKSGVLKPIFVGGIIPGDDAEQLEKMGVSCIFGPGASLQEIVTAVQSVVEKARSGSGLKKATSASKKAASPSKSRMPSMPLAKTKKSMAKAKKSTAKTKKSSGRGKSQ